MSSKGQITIPVSVRSKLNLKAGDNVVIFEDSGRFYIENAAAISLKYIGPVNDADVQYDHIKNDGSMAAEQGVRYCTVRESLEDSLKEVKDIREGKRSGMTLDDLFENIKALLQEKEQI